MTARTPEAAKYLRPGCSTGKLGWVTRRGAKGFNNRIVRQGGDRLGAYRCDECHYWHLGHLPQAVRQGIIGRTDYYNTKNNIPTIGGAVTSNSQEHDRRIA